MRIPRLLNSVFSKSIFVLVIYFMLSACSSEENYTGGLDEGAGALGSGVVGGPGQVTLNWVAPAEREDGTPISMAEIAGYRVYYGMSEGDYSNEVDISDGDTMQVTLNSLVSGTYYIVVTTYDMDGRESAFSEPIIASV